MTGRLAGLHCGSRAFVDGDEEGGQGRGAGLLAPGFFAQCAAIGDSLSWVEGEVQRVRAVRAPPDERAPRAPRLREAEARLKRAQGALARLAGASARFAAVNGRASPAAAHARAAQCARLARGCARAARLLGAERTRQRDAAAAALSRALLSSPPGGAHPDLVAAAAPGPLSALPGSRAFGPHHLDALRARAAEVDCLARSAEGLARMAHDMTALAAAQQEFQPSIAIADEDAQTELEAAKVALRKAAALQSAARNVKIGVAAVLIVLLVFAAAVLTLILRGA